jgi:hypothetical protein
VPGSRRYTDPTTLLIPTETWAAQRDDFCAVTGVDADPTRQLQRLEAELHAAVTDLERVLADPTSEGLARVDEDGDLIVSPLPAEQIPTEGEELAQAVVARLPQIHLPALLIAVDRDTRFSEAFTDAGGAQPRNRPDPQPVRLGARLRLQPRLRRHGRRLRHFPRHPRLDIAVVPAPRHLAGGERPRGQCPSSPPARRAVGRRDAVILGRTTIPAARPQPHRPGAVALLPHEGTTTYTHVSDQHSTYGTTVIPTTWREAVAVLDDIFGNPTDLRIAEHTTDTAGQTLATFAIFNLVGLQFSPRIRDIGRLQLYRLDPGASWRTRYPHAGALLTQPIQTQLIADHWNDLLRLVGSMKFGHTTASLLIAKLHASSRQNSLARALHEYGRLIRTIYLPLRR